MNLSTKRKVKIFVIPIHNTAERISGVDFARLMQPMKHLDKLPNFQCDILSNETKLQTDSYLLDIMKNYDIVYFNYMGNDWGFAHMKVYSQHFNTKLVLDIDDALWYMQPDNVAYEAYKPGSNMLRNFTIICGEVDGITTTSSYLKNVICNNSKASHQTTMVFPNYIDLDLYSHRCKFKDTHEINLLHFGSSTHYFDLEDREFVDGIDRIMSEYPNVVFTTIGSMMPKFKEKWGARYQQGFGHVDVLKWIKNIFPKVMDETDIMVVPLADNIYTRSKSSIKFLEASSACVPGVWQDIRQYQEVVDNGKNGFLAKTSDQWYRSIKQLIDDKELRRKMGRNAFKTVKNSWQMKDHVNDYAKWFLDIIS